MTLQSAMGSIPHMRNSFLAHRPRISSKWNALFQFFLSFIVIHKRLSVFLEGVG
jgi:hypothetical protein